MWVWVWMLAFGCGGASASPDVVGCWKTVSQHDVTECFRADGTYTLDSSRIGQHEGTWALDGDQMTVTVGSFSSETFTATLEGDRLTLKNPDRTYEMDRK
jgi:hypothetical protein